MTHRACLISFLATLGFFAARPAVGASQDNNIEWDGVFADTTAVFVTPAEVVANASVTIRMRARANDLTSATCRLYFVGPGNSLEAPLSKVSTGTLFDMWSASVTIPATTTAVYYRFKLVDGTDTDWYDAGDKSDSWTVRGMSDSERSDRDFLLLPEFATPDWSKRAVWYQIFPDRFYNADAANDRQYPDDCFWYLDYAPACRDAAQCDDYVNRCGAYSVPPADSNYEKLCLIHETWDESPNGGPCDFFGGDLAGIEAKLSYIKGVGATSIYVNPIFESMSNHKYDTMDYDAIDARFGADTALESLTQRARQDGIQVIADGVFNHGSDVGLHYNGWLNYAYGSSNGTASGLDSYATSCGAWEEKFLNSQASNWTDCSSDYLDWFKLWNGTDTYDVDRDGNESEAAAHNCGWAGLEFMPEYDFKSPSNANSETRRWLYGGASASEPTAASQSLAGRWLKDGGAINVGLDGWRLDVPDNAGYFTGSSDTDCSKTRNDATIWQGFREAVKATNDDAVIIGEIWADATSSGGVNWFNSLTYDGVMNYYYFGMPMSCFITGYGVHYDASECTGEYAALTYSSGTSVDSLDAHLATQRRLYPSSAYQTSQNLLSSHDTSRFLSRANGNVTKLKEAMLFQAMLPGAPMVYYGDEVGAEGIGNELSRIPFPWDALANSNSTASQLKDFTSQLMCIRQAYDAIETGSFVTLWTHNDHKTYGFGRFDANSSLAIAVNNSTTTHSLTLQVYRLGLVDGTVLMDPYSGTTFTVSGGTVTVSVAANGFVLLIPESAAGVAVNCVVGDVNNAPQADAGLDQTLCPGDTVTLDGTGSEDSDGDSLSYQWRDSNNQLLGTTPILEISGLSTGTYTYTLHVDDNKGGTDDDQIVVTVLSDSDRTCGSSGCQVGGSAAPRPRAMGAWSGMILFGLYVAARRRRGSRT